MSQGIEPLHGQHDLGDVQGQKVAALDVHELMGECITPFARGIISLEPFRQQDHGLQKAGDQRTAIEKACADLEPAAHLELGRDLMGHLVHRIAGRRGIVADQLVEDRLPAPGKTQHNGNPDQPDRYQHGRQRRDDAVHHAGFRSLGRSRPVDFHNGREFGGRWHLYLCIHPGRYPVRCGNFRRFWSVLRWCEEAEQRSIGRERGHE